MDEICRICLINCTQTRRCKRLNDIGLTVQDNISYRQMLQYIVNVQVKDDQILCSSCCGELLMCYKFLLKIEEANKLFLCDIQTSNADEDCNEDIRDPLEDTDDEPLAEAPQLCKSPALSHYAENFNECDSNLDTPKDMINNNLFLTANEAPSFFVTIEEREDGDELHNDLSDITVSAENLIFPQGRFKCKICDKSYFTMAGVSAHQEVHVPKAPATRKKRLRGTKKTKSYKSFIPSDAADNTNNSATESEITATTSLPKSTANLNSLDVNKNTPTGAKDKQPKPKKMFPCHICGKHMISASKLRYHMVMHTGEKDYLCSMCPKAYSTIYALKHHFRSHTGDRPYECKFCGDRFTRPTTLKSHVRRHTGERPYGCEICGKRFIQHSSMTTHIKLNHMAKTIPCPHCEKKYARQTDLNTHMLSHTGDKPFPCQLCPSRFIRQANLNKHMNQHHSERSTENKKLKKVIEENENSIAVASELQN